MSLFTPPSASSIPAGNLAPNLMARAADSVVCDAVGLQHPIREIISRIGDQSRQKNSAPLSNSTIPSGTHLQNSSRGTMKVMSMLPLVCSISAASTLLDWVTGATDSYVCAAIS